MKKILFASLAAALVLGFASCNQKPATTDNPLTVSGLDPKNFETDSTQLYVLKNAAGMEVCFTNFGGRIVSIMVPDKDGNLLDVCLGHDNIADYVKYGAQGCNFGALIGRYGNRIGKGQFSIDGEDYQLILNNNGNTLHGGGDIAFHNRIWDGEQTDDKTLTFTTFSPDGEDGFPGNVNVKVVYTLTDDNALKIDYEATTDKATHLNLTNHCYFNLSGDGSKDCLGEILQIDADSITAVDVNVLTTGEVLAVEGTPFDFRTPTVVGDRINDETNEQIKNGTGYDHNWILNNPGDINKVFGTIYDPTTGIVMEMFTTEPGVQFYAGNFLDGSFIGKKGVAHPQRSAFCFETQHYPDTPNQPAFPTTLVRPEDTYKTTTVYKFGVK